VTELRVHGVGGTPPDAILGDLAPEQASGDTIAGFYRTSGHRASPEDQAGDRDVGRHVECYSWGGLTSRSKTRVLWLALLPFLLANLAGWMCSESTRQSRRRFGLHRLSCSLGALALTVNASLVAVMITADVLAYQAVRARLAGHQWWLAPLGWHFISGHPARQVLIGVLVPVVLVLVLAGGASRSWRYEAVRPPSRGQIPDKPRKATAAALGGGLADNEFWDGEGSVRLLTWLHIAVVTGFLAIVLGVTAKALTAAGSPDAAWWWMAMSMGGAALVLAVAYLCLDAFGALPAVLRGSPVFLLIPAATALVSSGVFAWLQPAGPAGPAAELPGMASVIRWTVLAIAVPVATALISVLLGLRDSKGTLIGGPWVTLVLAFSMLNILMLGTEIWVAHLVGPVTSSAAAALTPQAKIYLPYVITAGVPLVVWAAVLAGLAFAAAEFVRWLRAHQLPGMAAMSYRIQAEAFRDQQSDPLKCWYRSGLPPFAPPGDNTGDGGSGGQDWEQKIARAQFLGRAPHDATWLLWSLILAQLAMAWVVWQFHVQPPVVIRNIGVSIAGLVVPALMGFLYSAWNDPARRRTIAVLWDVGTFWPRSYHPLSPPCYTERAIPELQRRMWWLHDNGGRVVLIGHSQGAMLATAALVQPGCRPGDDHPALITFGSPVCKLYRWGFPAYITPELLASLAPGGPGRVDDWRNIYYPTDPIGGPAGGVLSPADGKRVDEEMLDPAGCWYIYGQNPPSPQGHSGYWADLRVWDLINQTAARPGQRDPVAAPLAHLPR
jgi:hypothetical protein